MIQTFIDSSFWIALRARGEPEHESARVVAQRLADERSVLIATDLVFAEVQAYFCRFSRLREQVIHDFWNSGLFRFQDATLADKMAAIELLRKQQDKSYSFCDAVSFVLMKRLQIRRVATFDQHFRQFAHFEVLE